MGTLANFRSILRRQIEQNLNQRSQQLDLLGHRLQHPAQRLAQQRDDLLNLQRRLDSALTQTSTRGRNAIAGLTRRLLLARPDTSRLARRIEALAPRLRSEWQQSLHNKSGDLARLAASLNHLNPHAVLARGYSIVTDDAGHILSDSRSLEPNDRIVVSFHSGQADARVTSVTKEPASGKLQSSPTR